jgi:hypothetical protein
MQLLSAYCPCQTLQTEAARWRLRPGRKISGCRRRRRVGRSLRVRYLRARLTPTWPVGSTRSSSISAWLDSEARSARRSYFCDGEYQTLHRPTRSCCQRVSGRSRYQSRGAGAHRGGLGRVNSSGRDVAEYNLERKHTSSTSSAGLPKRRAVDTYPCDALWLGPSWP